MILIANQTKYGSIKVVNFSWLEENDIEMYSMHIEEKTVIAERFIRTLKNKIYEYMKSISKNVYINKLEDTVNKYNDKCHSAIKINLLM